MSAESAEARAPRVLNYDIQKLVEEIAIEVDLKDFEIKVDGQDFTGDNYMGEITRIKLTPVKRDGQKSINLFLKTATLSPISRDACPVILFYKREIFVYTDVLPVFERLQEVNSIPVEERMTFAKFYKGITEEFKEMVIMKDLICDGYVLRDKNSPFDYEHAALVIQNLARLHAFSFVLKEQEPELFSRLSDSLPHTANYGEGIKTVNRQLSQKIIPLIGNVKNRAKFETFAKNPGEKLENYLDASVTEPYNVICHGDCWNNNMLFKYENNHVTEVVFVDWQIVRFASPVTDLAYTIAFSLDQDLLEARLPDLWDLYYATLEKHIRKMGCNAEKCYPKEIFNEHIKKLMGFGLLFGICGIPMTLADPGEARPMEDIFNEADQDETHTAISDRASTRLNGLIDYFVKHQII